MLRFITKNCPPPQQNVLITSELGDFCETRVSGQAARLAFTLAEVLVTLGIIGVVSAMTLPTLVKNHQRQVYVTQLHKFYNITSQAIELYVNDNKAVNLGETPLRNSISGMKSFINGYFKVVKDCNGSYAPCFADEYKTIDGSGINKVKEWQCGVTAVIADGTAICVDTAHLDAIEDENNEENNVHGHEMHAGSVISFEFDINGKQGPNIYGRDYFNFHIDRNGNIFDDYNKDTFKTSDVFNFVGKIIDDGWKMEY